MIGNLVTRVWLPVRRRLAPLHTRPVNGFRMTIDLRDQVMSYILVTQNAYEQHLLDLIGKLPLTGGLAVDVGGNFGLYATALGRAVGPSGKVYAFEPDAHNFTLLGRNLVQNDLGWVEPVRAAVGREAGTLTLHRNASNFGDHFVSDRGEGEAVPVVTLDAFLADRQPPQPLRFIKIDVQGFERFVLEGGRRVLTSAADAFVQIEIQPDCLRRQGHTAGEVVRLLYDMGYVGVEVHANRLIPMGVPEAYDLFLDHSAVDCLLCRDPDLLRRTLADAYRLDIPAAALPTSRP